MLASVLKMVLPYTFAANQVQVSGDRQTTYSFIPHAFAFRIIVDFCCLPFLYFYSSTVLGHSEICLFDMK